MDRVIRLLRWSLVLGAIWIFVSPASANVITDFSFSGSIVTPSAPITGTFAFDQTTFSVTGPWSFSTPIGVLSSSDVGASATFGCLGPPFCYFSFDGPPLATNVYLLFIASGFPPYSGGSIDSGSSITLINTTFDLQGTVTAQAPSPEPSSLLLLGTGLLGLPALRKKWFA